MDNNPKIKDFCCINCFIENIVNEVLDHDSDDFYNVTVVANGQLTEDLLHLLVSIQDSDDEFLFDLSYFEFDPEYTKEYLITLTNDLHLSVEKAYYEKEDESGYLNSECDAAYVYQDSDFEVTDKIEANKIVIFGFENENAFDD